MKFLIGLIFITLSFSIWATEEIQSPKICYTHGQCQSEQPDFGYKCFIVKTGVTPDGIPTCTLRCPVMLMGSFCEPVIGRAWGICKKESYSVPPFNPSDCSMAIDPDEL